MMMGTITLPFGISVCGISARVIWKHVCSYMWVLLGCRQDSVSHSLCVMKYLTIANLEYDVDTVSK